MNLYVFVGNDPVNAWDLLGLTVITYEPKLLSGGQVDESDDAYLGIQVWVPSVAASSVIPSDDEIEVNSIAAAGMISADSFSTISISCDRCGNISYSVQTEKTPFSGANTSGSLSVWTRFHVREIDLGVEANDFLALEAFGVAYVQADPSLPLPPFLIPGIPWWLDIGTMISDNSQSLSAYANNSYAYRCEPEEGP